MLGSGDILPWLTVGDGSGGDLYAGDNLRSLAHLAVARDAAVASAVALLYTDPPYNTGTSWANRDQQVAYEDTWATDADFYAFLRPRLEAAHGLLSPDGSAYVHIDKRIAPYLRVMLDEIFGPGGFRNEITRIKCNPKNFARSAYGSVTDTILFYGVAAGAICWNDHRLPLTAEEIVRLYPKTDTSGRRYATTPLHGKGETQNGPTGQPWRGLMPPQGKHWRRPPAELEKLDQQGRIEWSSTGNPREIIYADESRGMKLQDLWEFKDRGFRREEYPTEKPLEMLELIVCQSSRPGDLVADIFAGSGTTLVAAARHGRRFLGMDQGGLAIATQIARLLAETECRDFTVWRSDAPETTAQLELVPTAEGRMRARLEAGEARSLFAVSAGPVPGTWSGVPLEAEMGDDGWADLGVVPAEASHLLGFARDGALALAPLPVPAAA